MSDAWGAINSDLAGAIANSPAFLSQLTNNTAYQDPNHRAPNVSMSGLTGLGNGSAPYFERNIDRNIFDNLSIQYGNHTIRTGFTSMWMQKTENASAGAASFNFVDDTTTGGDGAFANFLLGQADSYTQPNKDTIPHLQIRKLRILRAGRLEGDSQADGKRRHSIQLLPLAHRQQQYLG